MYIQDFIKYIQAPEYLGVVSAISQADKTITVAAAISSQVTAGAKVRIQGISSTVDQIYTVVSAELSGANTVITITEDIPAEITITSTMNVGLYKGVDTAQAEINLAFDNKEVSLDDAEQPFSETSTLEDNIVKLEYNKEGNKVNCKTYGYLLTPYEEQTQAELQGVLDKVGLTKLNEYFKGIYETFTTFFSGLTTTEVDAHRTAFYTKMQDASIEDAGSFVIINPDQQAKVRVESIYFFIDNYTPSETNKIKYMSYGEAIPVQNPDGVEEIITCARACSFEFKESV